MHDSLRQSILNVAVLALAALIGLGAYWVGSRIYHQNQLYAAVTKMITNASTLQELNIVVSQQQQQITQLESMKANLGEKLESLQQDKK